MPTAIGATPDRNLLLHHFHKDFVPGFILFVSSILCLLIRSDLMYKARRKFTFGESAIISQLASLAFCVWAFVQYHKFSGAGPFSVDITTEIVLSIGMSVFGVVFLPSYLGIDQRNTVIRYSLIALAIAISYSTAKSLTASPRIGDPITWIIDYIFATHQRISLFSLWLSTVAACVSFSTSWTRMVGQTNSLVRKVFHLAMCVVFITGYNQDIDFTRFASGGMIIVMLLLEIIRVWNVWPIGYRLERVCAALRGKWDNRFLTLSHMYLLIGTMLPLWLLPRELQSDKLAISCGLISIGVGDTAAALVGTFYGRTKINSESNKTLEGFLGNAIAMVLFKLVWIGYADIRNEYSFVLVATFTATSEMLTANCDNLVLPLVMMLTLELF